jgi:hypothetical protein
MIHVSNYPDRYRTYTDVVRITCSMYGSTVWSNKNYDESKYLLSVVIAENLVFNSIFSYRSESGYGLYVRWAECVLLAKYCDQFIILHLYHRAFYVLKLIKGFNLTELYTENRIVFSPFSHLLHIWSTMLCESLWHV